jgi:hypothetical protein
MAIDSRAGAEAGFRAGRSAGRGRTQSRSFAPTGLRSKEVISFADKSDGWTAETDFVAAAAKAPPLRAVDQLIPILDRTEALAMARLAAAELARPGVCLGLAAAAQP